MKHLSVIDTWGTTVDERAAAYGCDGLIERPDRALYRGVDVAAPDHLVFRWLCQLRAAPYSYDLVDNRGRRSPRRLIDGLDRLEVGQRFMGIFHLVAFEAGRSITLDSDTARFGRVTGTYVVTRIGTNRSRLVAKLEFTEARGRVASLIRRHIVPAGDLIMMRKQLLTLKKLAERDASEARG